MGRVSFDEAQEIAKEKENQGSDIGFFALKRNKDTATVRFLHEGLRDIETLAIHYVKTKDGKTKVVSCARNPREPIANCPICADNKPGENMQIRYYIHLLEYKQNDKGEWVGEHKVFDRGSSFIKQLESYASRYNPLHAHLFDIERIGDAGSRETSYNIIPLPDNYNDTRPYYEDDLDYVKALGTIVADKTYEQLEFFKQNGYFEDDANKGGDSDNGSTQAFDRVSNQNSYSAPNNNYNVNAEPRRREADTAQSNVGSVVSGPRRRV